MKTLLVALDGSPTAQAVLDEALRLARATGARMVLFRAVTSPRELPLEVFVASPESVAEILRSKARRELEAMTIAVPPELLKGVRVELGIPASAICEAAVSEQADLIVIGSHGHRFLDKVLGTTAARVVNLADRSVLVVRARREG